MRLIPFLFLLLCSSMTYAQFSEADLKKYPFIKHEQNFIHNDSVLYPFFDSLFRRETGSKDLITVAHIGDSHIQADLFSGKIREALQRRFGNAGRGLVFPYRAARSNEPYSIKSRGEGKWKSGRNVVNRDSLPIGISGFSIESRDSSAMIFLRTENPEGLNYSFNVIEVFCENDSDYCRPILTDTGSVRSVHAVASEKQKEIFQLEQMESSLVLKRTANDTISKLRIYGINLLNKDSGLLYHTIGVNGAEFRHYNSSEYFFGQLFDLNPQLVIASMGTNEAYGKGFNANEFVKSLKQFADTIKKSLPGTVLLFTIPSDSYRGKYRNKTVELVRTLMIEFCLQNGIAYWDLFEVMGGAGSMSKWYAKGLSARDRLHFNRKGYELQGWMFNKAFFKSYDSYTGNKRL